MTVKQLIARLQKMPQNLPVVYSHQDNNEWETAGDICSVMLLDKDEIKPSIPLHWTDQERYDSMPKQQVVIRG